MLFIFIHGTHIYAIVQSSRLRSPYNLHTLHRCLLTVCGRCRTLVFTRTASLSVTRSANRYVNCIFRELLSHLRSQRARRTGQTCLPRTASSPFVTHLHYEDINWLYRQPLRDWLTRRKRTEADDSHLIVNTKRKRTKQSCTEITALTDSLTGKENR